MCSTIINREKIELLIEDQKKTFINISDYEAWRNRILAKVELRDKSIKDFKLRDSLVYELGSILNIPNKNILIDEPTHHTLVLKLRPTGEKPFDHKELIPIYRDIIKFRTKHDDLSGYNTPRCDVFEYKDTLDFSLKTIFTYCLKNGYDSIFVDKYVMSGFYGGLGKLLPHMINGIKLYYYEDDKLVEISINKEVVK